MSGESLFDVWRFEAGASKIFEFMNEWKGNRKIEREKEEATGSEWKGREISSFLTDLDKISQLSMNLIERKKLFSQKLETHLKKPHKSS